MTVSVPPLAAGVHPEVGVAVAMTDGVLVPALLVALMRTS
jgi:hypothetical protein